MLALVQEALDEIRAGLRRDPDVMSIGEVAAALICTEDTIRRIPPVKLPVYRVGKTNVYVREDVLRYLRSRPAERRPPGGQKSPAVSNKAGADAFDDLIADVVEGKNVRYAAPPERRAR